MNLRSEAAIYFAGRLAPAMITAATVAILTRLLTPSEFGSYALFAGAVLVVNAVGFQWLRLSVLRFSFENRNRAGTFAATSRRLFGFCALAACGLAGIAMLTPTSSTYRPTIGAALLFLISLALAELCQELLRANQRPIPFGLVSLARAAVTLGLTLLLVPSSTSATAAIAATAGGSASAAVLGLFLTRLFTVSGSYDGTLAREFWEYGAPLTAVFALEHVLSVSDRYLIGSRLGAAPAGLYAAAYDYPRQALSVTSSAVALGALPRAIKAVSVGGAEEVDHTLRSNFRLLLFAVLSVGTTLLALRESIAELMLGSAFRHTATILQPLIIAGLMAHVLRAFYFDHAFQLAKHPRMQLISVAFAATVNVGLNIAFLPKFGIVAAAWSTAVTYLFALVASAMLGRSVFRLPIPANDLMRSVVAAALGYGMLNYLAANVTSSLALLLVAAALFSAGLASLLGIVSTGNRFRRRVLRG